MGFLRRPGPRLAGLCAGLLSWVALAQPADLSGTGSGKVPPGTWGRSPDSARSLRAGRVRRPLRPPQRPPPSFQPWPTTPTCARPPAAAPASSAPGCPTPPTRPTAAARRRPGTPAAHAPSSKPCTGSTCRPCRHRPSSGEKRGWWLAAHWPWRDSQRGDGGPRVATAPGGGGAARAASGPLSPGRPARTRPRPRAWEPGRPRRPDAALLPQGPGPAPGTGPLLPAARRADGRRPRALLPRPGPEPGPGARTSRAPGQEQPSRPWAPRAALSLLRRAPPARPSGNYLGAPGLLCACASGPSAPPPKPRPRPLLPLGGGAAVPDPSPPETAPALQDTQSC